MPLPSLYWGPLGPIAIFHVAFHSESLGSEINLCVGTQQCLWLTGVTRGLTVLFPKCFLIPETTAGYLVRCELYRDGGFFLSDSKTGRRVYMLRSMCRVCHTDDSICLGSMCE